MDFSDKLEGLFEEIHEKQKKRDMQLMGLISELKPYMTDIGDATLLVPLIAKYMDLAVKNDDVLVKLASLVYKAVSAEASSEDSFGLSDEEKKQLMDEFNKLDDKINND
jgi:hypothetical protein